MTLQQIQRIKELRYAMLLLSQCIVEEIEKENELSEMQYLLEMQKHVIEELLVMDFSLTYHA